MNNLVRICLFVCLVISGCDRRDSAPKATLELRVGTQAKLLDGRKEKEAVLSEVLQLVKNNWDAQEQTGTDWIQLRSVVHASREFEMRDATFTSERSTDEFRLSMSNGLIVVETKRDDSVEQKGSTNSTDWNVVNTLLTSSPLNDKLLQNILRNQTELVDQIVR